MSLHQPTVCSEGGRGVKDEFSKENPEAEERQLFEEAIPG
jgi:hypothetical protein